MKTILNLALEAASVGFGVVMPAWSADAPAASATQAGGISFRAGREGKEGRSRAAQLYA